MPQELSSEQAFFVLNLWIEHMYFKSLPKPMYREPVLTLRQEKEVVSS